MNDVNEFAPALSRPGRTAVTERRKTDSLSRTLNKMPVRRSDGDGWSHPVAKRSIGKLRPRYSFILNPYRDARLSKCPKCERLTFLRNFAMFIHVDKWGPLVLGKTCRYCARCELIVAHQDELEAELAHSLAKFAPEAVGSEYLV